jgi:hypothetical protein
MSEILINKAVQNIDRNYNYKLDKEGNLIREKYSLFKDPYTLVTVCIIILAFFYYMQVKDNPSSLMNIDETCERYIMLKYKWIDEHPNKSLDVEEIVNQVVMYAEEKKSIGLFNSSPINMSII